VTWIILIQDLQDLHLHLHAADAGLDRQSVAAGTEVDRHIGAGLQSVETVAEIEGLQTAEVSLYFLLHLPITPH
jgi:hypothetical protein